MMDPMQAARSWMALARLGHAWTSMCFASGTVIARRTAMMAAGKLSAPEAVRMVAEKQVAFAEAARRAAKTAARGGDATRVAAAALKPIRARAGANARRLSR